MNSQDEKKKCMKKGNQDGVEPCIKNLIKTEQIISILIQQASLNSSHSLKCHPHSEAKIFYSVGLKLPYALLINESVRSHSLAKVLQNIFRLVSNFAAMNENNGKYSR